MVHRRVSGTLAAALLVVGLGSAAVPSAHAAAGTTVTGVVFQDADRDGVRDVGERPASGAEVTFTQGMPIVIQVRADSAGRFTATLPWSGPVSMVVRGGDWLTSSSVTLDGSPSKDVGNVPTTLSLRAALEVKMTPARTTVRYDQRVRFSLTVDNVSGYPISGVRASCWDNGNLAPGSVVELTDSGILETWPTPNPGITLAPGTRTLRFAGRLTDDAILNGTPEISCVIKDDHSGNGEGSALLTVRGGVTTVTGRTYFDNDGDGTRDADEYYNNFADVVLRDRVTHETYARGSYVDNEGAFVIRTTRPVAGSEVALEDWSGTYTAAKDVTLSPHRYGTVEVGDLPVTFAIP
ncbi:hypothetical protein [Luteipulveratus flavus]|uniref:SD-repeat containing protein B domain-containing protein n=1 Tax=Luteipulveratus flavus TaxID=3031728 RepID=A0ABT6C9P0_9MICO|nr:hypothetical protein [Luteipulveratus sp. YIM 133296]MDF8265624.1 hypothetical protein [Luteipulveratus sp. YIM 133296]